jgi:hypothetical protein
MIVNICSSDLDIHTDYLSRSLLSPTLHRSPIRYRYPYSPASDLSNKIIDTLQHNLDSYVSRQIFPME